MRAVLCAGKKAHEGLPAQREAGLVSIIGTEAVPSEVGVPAANPPGGKPG